MRLHHVLMCDLECGLGRYVTVAAIDSKCTQSSYGQIRKSSALVELCDDDDIRVLDTFANAKS
jgi:hypothetical protein